MLSLRAAVRDSQRFHKFRELPVFPSTPWEFVDIFDCGSQQFADTPCLGNASRWLMRGAGIGDFGNLAERRGSQVLLERLQQLLGVPPRFIAPIVRRDNPRGKRRKSVFNSRSAGRMLICFESLREHMPRRQHSSHRC